jgi:hypothetical protein
MPFTLFCGRGLGLTVQYIFNDEPGNGALPCLLRLRRSAVAKSNNSGHATQRRSDAHTRRLALVTDD